MKISLICFKEYELLKTVGKGGFGTVYLAKRLRDNKEVAIKKVRTSAFSALVVS